LVKHCPINIATFSFPVEFRCIPCQVNYFLSRLTSSITMCDMAFVILLSFLLKACISLLTQEDITKSCLCKAGIFIIFICWFCTKKFIIYFNPIEVSFLFISFEPLQIIIQSLWFNLLI
jgi:hypothetical protein